MFVRTKKRGERTYLMIVENNRVNGRVRQKVLHNLGRLDVLQATGRLDGLFHSLGRFAKDLVCDSRRGEFVAASSISRDGVAGFSVAAEGAIGRDAFCSALRDARHDRQSGQSVRRSTPAGAAPMGNPELKKHFEKCPSRASEKEKVWHYTISGFVEH